MFSHIAIACGRLIDLNPDMSVNWDINKRVGMRGSHESRVSIKSVPNGKHCPKTGKPMAGSLQFDGNLVKFLQGHNVFGIADMARLVSLFFDRVLAVHPGISDEVSIAAARKRAASGDFTVKGLDINGMYRLDNAESVGPFLHAAAMRARSRHGTANMDRGTVYLQRNSRRWALKMYNKFRELMSRKKGHQLPELPKGKGLEEWAQACVRVELRLLANELNQRNLIRGSDWTPSSCQALFSEYLGRVDMSAQVTLVDSELMQLPRCAQSSYQLWRTGACLRDMLPHRTFYRHRSILMEHGIDISVPPSDPSVSNVIPLFRVLEARPVGIPDWAKSRGLVAL